MCSIMYPLLAYSCIATLGAIYGIWFGMSAYIDLENVRREDPDDATPSELSRSKPPERSGDWEVL